jgi:hypothetical protein
LKIVVHFWAFSKLPFFICLWGNKLKRRAGLAIGATMALAGKLDITKLVGLGLLLLSGLARDFGNDEDCMPAPTHYPNP